MKLVKMLGIVLMSAMLVFSCTTEPTITTPPPVNEAGDSNWASTRLDDCNITIDKSFKYMGEKNLNEGKKLRTYYVWSKDGGNEFIYLIEWRHTSWSFPAGEDTLKPRDTDGLLKYEPNEYSIWSGIAQKSHRVLTKMGVNVAKDKVVIDKELCMNKYRNKVVWIVYGKAWDANHTDFEKIVEMYNKVVK